MRSLLAELHNLLGRSIHTRKGLQPSHRACIGGLLGLASSYCVTIANRPVDYSFSLG